MAVSQYLEQLLEEKKWEEALRAALQLLPRQDNTLEDIAWINHAISAGRIYHQKDYLGGSAAATIALRLAEREGLHALRGKVLVDLSMASAYTRQYNNTLRYSQDILQMLDWFGEDRPWFEAVAMHNIGFVRRKQGNFDMAIWAFEKAAQLYQLGQRPDLSLIILGLLLRCYVEAHNLEPVPALLRQVRRLIRKHNFARPYRYHYLYYTALFRFSRQRFDRAADLALKAMPARELWDDIPHQVHMLICQCLVGLGEHKDALGHALAARMAAIETKRFDQEFVAVEAMLEVIETQGIEVVRALDKDYCAIGVDLSHYVSESVLPQRN